MNEEEEEEEALLALPLLCVFVFGCVFVAFCFVRFLLWLLVVCLALLRFGTRRASLLPCSAFGLSGFLGFPPLSCVAAHLSLPGAAGRHALYQTAHRPRRGLRRQNRGGKRRQRKGMGEEEDE